MHVRILSGFGVLGAVMIIPNISRHCAGVYECEASNGVPPPVSRQMKITVECKLYLILLAAIALDRGCTGCTCTPRARNFFGV